MFLLLDPHQCQHYVSPKWPFRNACRRRAVQVRKSAGWGVCGFSFPSVTSLCSQVWKSCGCFFLAREPTVPQTPRHRKNELNQKPPSAPSVPFYLMYTLEQNKPGLNGNDCGRGEWRKVQVTSVWLKREQRERHTCSEKEHSHGAVVLPLRPPAQGNQGHQEGNQSRHSTGDEQHQGGNLPVCRARHTQVRAELPNNSSTHRTEPLNWTAVLTNTKQELIPQRETRAKWTPLKTSNN